MPFGAEIRPNGFTRFRLWAPAAAEVYLELPARSVCLPMQAQGHGWHELVTTATAGDRYQFRLPDGARVADPVSRCQAEDADGPSLIVDPLDYRWRNEGWRGRPWHEAVIYELHVGTFTPDGTFMSAIERLPYLRELGITAIELMPIADFPGARNWGYDGVLPFAPDRAYGSPVQLKALVDAAHGHGLMVLLDVVDNHFGPEGNHLARYAPGFYTDDVHTPWGSAINFREPTVRSFYIHNALYWLNEYRFDGLRFDAVHAIVDPSDTHIMVELARTVRTEIEREVHLILENEDNRASFLRHDPVLGRRLFDAQWNDDFHHCIHVLITGERAGYYGDFADAPAHRLRRALAEGFVYQGEPSPQRGGRRRGEGSTDLPSLAFAGFLQNHDQTGNRAFGERLTKLAPPEAVQACQALLLLCPHVPLLFMGEEWGARTPFLYFCDFHGQLAQSIREGRSREFAAFHARDADIPDPLDEASFVQSQLDWAELTDERHAAWLARTRLLLRIRAREIVPRLALGDARPCAGSALGEHALEVAWRFADASELALRANLGPTPVRFPGPMEGELLFATQVEPTTELAAWSIAWTRRQDC